MLSARNQKSLKLKVMIRINSVKLAYLSSLVVYVNALISWTKLNPAFT